MNSDIGIVGTCVHEEIAMYVYVTVMSSSKDLTKMMSLQICLYYYPNGPAREMAHPSISKIEKLSYTAL